LKKTGDSAKVVDRAKTRAETKPGTVGVKVSILSPEAELKDKITIDEELLEKIKNNIKEKESESKIKIKSSMKSKRKKK
jgi:ribosomal protein S3